MEWRDQGAVLAVRAHGETSAIVEVLTAEHGRHAGIVRGGVSRKIAPHLQPGSQVEVTWRARLDDHLGSFAVEPLKSRSAQALGDRLALAGLNAVTAMLCFAMPEREPHISVYEGSIALLDVLGVGPGWMIDYLRWERDLLEELGYGLDLGRCAVTGSHEDLIYVSPNSGRAVSRDGAGEWADRLLPLPPCLLGQGPATATEVLDGLRMTGHFLTHWLAHAMGDRPLPEARARLIATFARHYSD